MQLRLSSDGYPIPNIISMSGWDLIQPLNKKNKKK